jgi:deoxyribonuclease-4
MCTRDRDLSDETGSTICQERGGIVVKVGVHVSIAGSIARAVERAMAIDCDTFQIFSRNPRGWTFKPLTDDDAALFQGALAASGIGPAVVHMPYLPNLASPKEEIRTKSVEALAEELHRCSMLEIPYLVTHLGHHMGEGIGAGEERVQQAIDAAFSQSDLDGSSGVMLLLENTAGEKNSVGSRFEEIGRIRESCSDPDRIGVCMDTCHAFAAGYDLRNEEGLSHTLEAFEDGIGIEHLHVIHLNDAKAEIGSHLDRHTHIGLGMIGEEGCAGILTHHTLASLPFICETPEDAVRDNAANIRAVRKLAALRA